MDIDEDDYVFYGTPIEHEEELISRKKKAIAEASGHLRALPSWKQEVRDEEGRRRFHGAFTGGFSAGYYNTAGSKEGWTPQSFTSSRKNRAEYKQQSILNFLDEDEKAELEGPSLGTSAQFDTFGFTAAEVARKQAEKELQQRPSAIPGPAPDEIVLPATESIGVKLLLRMGWRHGHAIVNSRTNLLSSTRREARKAFLALSSDDTKSQLADFGTVEEDCETILDQAINDHIPTSQSTPVYILNPKEDTYGLGYDPYKHAPEFRGRKRSRVSGKKDTQNKQALSIKDSLFGLKSGRAAPGFGIGALEEYDAEDEDVYASAYDFEEADVPEDEESLRSNSENRPRLVWKEQGVLPGFKVATNSDYQLERFGPPVIPKDFVPHHKFPDPLESDIKHAIPPPPEVSSPEDDKLKVLIEGVATLVARCGKLFEDLSRQKNQSNPLFSFLTGGNGHEYYSRRLWEEQRKHSGQKKLALDGKSSSSVQEMTAESRGKFLGEMPLERSSRDLSSSADVNLPLSLSHTFTKPASFMELPEEAKLFKGDPAKQERFELFLKEKYEGGLRTTVTGGASNMSEASRASERLDFEAAAEAVEKGKFSAETKLFSQQLLEFSASGGMQFISGGPQQGKDTQDDDLAAKKLFPKREEFQWRPSPILCKRFDLVDPYMGKPPPTTRMRSKMDSLIFTSDVKAMKMEENFSADRIQPLDLQSTHEASKQTDGEVEVENVERPVDLYKAIFSDNSDDEVEVPNINRVENPEKKIDVAHSTLNRLMAGDFLESLGKELGLEVPSDPPFSTHIARSSAAQKDLAISSIGNSNILSVEENSFPTPNSGTVPRKEVTHYQNTAEGVESQKKIFCQGDPMSGSSKYKELGPSEEKCDEVYTGKIAQEDRKAMSPPNLHKKRSISKSSENERSRKQSRQYRYISNDSYSDSSSDPSSDHQDRYHSRSEGIKRRSSYREERSSKKYSKHHKHGIRDSSSKSHYGTEKEAKREKRKLRD